MRTTVDDSNAPKPLAAAHRRSPAFAASGGAGMSIGGDGPELLAKCRHPADLLNSVVDAERRRSAGRR